MIDTLKRSLAKNLILLWVLHDRSLVGSLPVYSALLGHGYLGNPQGVNVRSYLGTAKKVSSY
jgi:hypothetical protein